jgi:predicted RNA methylase
MSDRPRLLTPAAYGALKGATAAALAVATPQGTAEAFAELTRVEPRSLRKYADHAHDMFVPLDIAADLDRAAGKPILAAALAHLSGATVFTVEADAEMRALNALKEAGEAVSAIAQLASSGAWGLEQAKAARLEVDQAMAAFASVRNALTQRIEGSS